MADIFSSKRRSEIMSSIRSKNTKPELIFRKALFAKGFRYKINDPCLPGKPDIVLPKYKTVIFVHGCFWHGHKGCKDAHLPKTNVPFWAKKINDNLLRDIKAMTELTNMGYKIITVWECEISKRNLENRVKEVVDDIKSTSIK